MIKKTGGMTSRGGDTRRGRRIIIKMYRWFTSKIEYTCKKGILTELRRRDERDYGKFE
ncbi:MAG: hypothetical protein IJR96_06050 [Pseudobutyrivibrio sp.]|nr:hypothetical protein [Pseudobutyrivibrio sp.]